MAANNSPIFVLTPKVGGIGVNITAANTAKDGTGTVNNIYTAGANGAYIVKIKCKPLGTNTATVLRIFLNNGGSNTTATNNSMWKEITLPAITLTELASQSDFEYMINEPIDPTFKLNAVLATAVAAGWHVLAVGGDF